jgi:hypothetical protein
MLFTLGAFRVHEKVHRCMQWSVAENEANALCGGQR